MENNDIEYVNPLRADTDERKRYICDRIFEAWKARPELRLGQLLSASSTGRDLFYIEDVTLISNVDAFNRETHRT